MADESRTPLRLEGIDFHRTFPFTRIFSTFRVAIHPSKLLLALAAILIIYSVGRAMDGLWPAGSSAVPISILDDLNDPRDLNRLAARLGDRDRVDYSEVLAFEEAVFGGGNTVSDFRTLRLEARRQVERYDEAVRAEIARQDGNDATDSADDISAGDVRDYIARQRNEAVGNIRKEFEEQPRAALQEARKQLDEAEGEDAQQRARLAVEQAEERVRLGEIAARQQIEARYRLASAGAQIMSYEDGIGPFNAFYQYSAAQIDRIAQSTLSLDFLGPQGVFRSLFNLVIAGPAWALMVHPVYFIIFFLIALSVAAVAGGAIARIAAVHVARDEKISLRDALRFSTGKFLSFLTAPLIPIIILLFFGLLLAIGGALANVPYVGPILVGLLFFLALLAGFLMTLVVIGLIGGINLMYPTIAVEGSDSFDAISRSFSYLYAKPWRLIFYTFVALVYIALTYLFLRLFFWVLLGVTYFAVKQLTFVNEPYPGTGVYEAMWGGPDGFFNVTPDVDFFSLNAAESIAAFLVIGWVYLVVALLGAYLVSAFFSANTIIYYLMRREVDAQEMDDVYLEHDEEEFDTDPAASGGYVAAGASDAGEGSGEQADKPSASKEASRADDKSDHPEPEPKQEAPGEGDSEHKG